MYKKTILVLALFAVILTWSASDAKLFLDEYELDEYELELASTKGKAKAKSTTKASGAKKTTKSSSSTKSKSKGTKSTSKTSSTSTTNKKTGTTTPSSTKKTTTKGKDGKKTTTTTKTVTVSRKGPSLWVWGVFAVVVLVSAGYMYMKCSPNFKPQKNTGPEVYEGSDA